MQFIMDHNDDDINIYCDACLIGKVKSRPLINNATNRYAPLDAVSSNTTGPISQEYKHGSKYLQLLFDRRANEEYTQLQMS